MMEKNVKKFMAVILAVLTVFSMSGLIVQAKPLEFDVGINNVTGFTTYGCGIGINGTTISATAESHFALGTPEYHGIEYLQIEEWDGYGWIIIANCGGKYVENFAAFKYGYSSTCTSGKSYRVTCAHYAIMGGKVYRVYSTSSIIKCP